MSDRLKSLLAQQNFVETDVSDEIRLQREKEKLQALQERYKRLRESKLEFTPEPNPKIIAAMKKSLAIPPRKKIWTANIYKKHLPIADVYWKQKQYRKALEEYIQVKKPDSSLLTQYKIAYALEKNGKWKQAIKIYKKIAGKNPEKFLGKHSAWNVDYVSWKRDTIQKLSPYLSMETLGLLPKKEPEAVKKETSKEIEKEEKPVLPKVKKKPIDLSDYKSFVRSLIPPEKIKKIPPIEEKKENDLMQDYLIRAKKYLNQKRPKSLTKFRTYPIEKQKRHVKNLIRRLEKHQKKFVKQIKNITTHMSELEKASPDLILRESFRMVIAAESYDKGLRKSLEKAKKALEEKRKKSFLEEYKKILPFYRLSRKKYMLKGISLADAQMGRYLKYLKEKALKAPKPAPKYLGKWFRRLLPLVNKLQESSQDNVNLIDTSSAIYLSRIRNYMIRIKTYPSEIGGLIKKLNLKEQEKNVQKWILEQRKKKKGMLGQKRQLDCLEAFLTKKRLIISMKEERKNLEKSIAKFARLRKTNVSMPKQLLKDIFENFRKVHDKYEYQIRLLTSAIANFEYK